MSSFGGSDLTIYTDARGRIQSSSFKASKVPFYRDLVSGIPTSQMTMAERVVANALEVRYSDPTGGYAFADSYNTGIESAVDIGMAIETGYGLYNTAKWGYRGYRAYRAGLAARGMSNLAEGAGEVVAKASTTALRKVGSVLESVEDVMTNPNLLKDQPYFYVRNILGNSKNWVNDVMRKSTRAEGWVLRELNKAGNDFTGRMIQYHPGTPRHFGGAPYWKVSSGNGTFRIPLNP